MKAASAHTIFYSSPAYDDDDYEFFLGGVQK